MGVVENEPSLPFPLFSSGGGGGENDGFFEARVRKGPTS